MAQFKNFLKKIIFFIIALCVGGFVGYWVGGLIKSNMIYIPSNFIWVLFLLILPIYLLAIAVHEAGHALAGVSQNFDFTMYLVGPFMFEKGDGKWSFKWNKGFNLSGGLVLCLPKDTVNIVNRFIIFVLGGPLTSLIAALGSFGIYLLIGGSNEGKGYFVNALSLSLLLFTALSFIVFLMTIIPVNANGFHTDGARFLRLVKGGTTGKLESLILTIISKVMGGIRPKNYDTNEIVEAKQLANELKDSYEVYLDGFLFHNYFDIGELEAAEICLNTYLANIEKMPDGFRGTLWIEASFFYAFAKNDLDKAKYYYHQYKPSPLVPKAQVLAAEAAILRLEGKESEMLTKIDQSLALNGSMLDKGLAIAMKERLELMKFQTLEQ
ncbi:MAG TPA: M50 family metallopeptidase [Saprospiraceae bacterium]|nr:M50 family metallopeptidase [Saprospiraceae bacterium]